MILSKYQLDWKKLILSAVSAFLVATAYGQTVVSEQTDTGADTPVLVSVSPLEQAKTALSLTFQQKQQTLNQAEDTLLARGATDEQITTWEQQNAAAFQTQLARMQLLGAYAQFETVNLINDVLVPEGASKTMEDFLVLRGTLYNERAQLHNQLFQGDVGSITVQKANALEQNLNDLFQPQHRAELQAEANQAKLLADQLEHQLLPVPDPLQIPANANPQLAALLRVRDQIERGEIAVHNQYCAGDLSQLETALEQWREQNAGLYQQMKTYAQALPQTNPDLEPATP